MNKFTLFLTTFVLAIALHVKAQPGTWNREKYPDLPDPKPAVNMKVARQIMARIQQRKAEGKVRPDHLNNALQPSFPPIINQSGGSCGAASSIYYQFTNQINTARFVAADADERRYATHFPWLFNTNGPSGTGYDKLGHDVGIASCAVYGGTTYSRVYGHSGQDDQDDDCGWMQGYDSWFATMHNRILHGNSFPMNCGTEEGRELVKNYLWNRFGDESYASGGICGIGVAAGPFEGNIPKTDANVAAGVVGMKYVTDWNETYNHAMTIVGYDDRLEFDLDGNGIVGEALNSEGDDERGAWIICNSWGDGYANNGFIYCPYERSNSVKGWPKENSFTPGYYDIMRDYRPLRTLRVKMEYSRRSEIALHIGVAQNLNATKPEKSTVLTHFEYAGDGNQGRTQPAPEIPMLGRWADGELHTEPMEFGYDLTALTQDFDLMRPLKYFFWVETRAWGEGEGKIHEVSIIDYTLDRDGMEVPFPIAAPVLVPSAGKKTELTAVVCGDDVPEPRNLCLSGEELCWDAPAGSPYVPESYRIYLNGTALTTVEASEQMQQRSAVHQEGCYTVSALYMVRGNEVESKTSAPVVFSTEQPTAQPLNRVAVLKRGSRIEIPELIDASTETFTIEFWVMPRTSATADSYGFRIKADTTTFFFKVISGNQMELGQDGGSYTRSASTLSAGSFHHIAIVGDGLYTSLYVDGKRLINRWKNNFGHYGIKGPARLILGQTEGTTSNYKKVYDAPWNGNLDELRFWTCARTQEQIKADAYSEVAQPLLIPELTHYYRMDTRNGEDSSLWLVDRKLTADALVITSAADDFTTEDREYGIRQNPLKLETSADFACDTVAVVGQPFKLFDQSAINTAYRQWTISGTGSGSLSGTVNPVVLFTETGEQTVRLQTTSIWGEQAEKTTTVHVASPVSPVVDFAIPEGPIGAGQHVTFINTSTPIEGTVFDWNIQGAEEPVVSTVNAAATFPAFGTYEVRLEARNSIGTSSVTKTVTVEAVSPRAAFSIANNVVVKGQEIMLFDASKFTPTAWQWDLSSNLDIYRYIGKDKSITIDEPGIYDVSLKVSNEKGSDQITRKKAIVICNADGKTGLHFDGIDDQVQAASPFDDTQVRAFTIEWWMYPGRVTDNSFHIGDKASTLQLCVKPTGEISIDINGKNGLSPAGTVISDEWHHYAVTLKSGSVTFFRDGVKLGSARVTATVPVLEQFTIGGTEQPFNGIVDELRVWNKALADKNITAIANEPVANPSEDETLLLYYDFNQSHGDVEDRSAHGLTGKRLNFGPDGDAWDNSLGIFCLNTRGVMIDVTATYLKNYKHPFKTGNGTVNPANSSRYLKLLMNKTTSPWKQLNTVKNGNILTEWHVDAEKNNYLTLEDTYSGFESDIRDLMIFQTVQLPAGQYTFTADRDGDDYYYNWLTDGTYVAAAAGEQLPLTADLVVEALASSPLSESQSVTFFLEDSTTVSLGLIANMHDKRCVAVGKFILQYKQLILGDSAEPDAIREPSLMAEQTLQAAGGFGAINLRVWKPQHVTITDLSGKVIFQDWLDTHAHIPAHRGIYVVNKQKILVR